MSKQAILDKIAEVSFKDEETGDELVYVGDVEFILTAQEEDGLTDEVREDWRKSGALKNVTAQEGESNQQYAIRKVKKYISGHSLSSGQEKLLFRVARWLEGPTIITEFPMKDAYPIDAQEGETFKYQEDINHDTKTIFVPPDRYFDLRGEGDKQIAKRMIEEFEKEVISEEYTFNPYQLALLAWIKRWLEKEGE